MSSQNSFYLALYRSTAHALALLATKENVANVIILYHEFFTPAQEGKVTSFVDANEVSIQFGTADKGADPGIEFESGL